MEQIIENIFLFEDICNVYAVRNGTTAVLIDFGSGDILDRLSEIGVEQVAGILMTHHHRDQGQGLPRAAAAGIPIWVPAVEQDLFSGVEEHWQAREIYNNYNVRQDRFSLLQSVPVSGILKDYAEYNFAGLDFTVIPTPGHTIGSISLLLTLGDTRLAFTGDLIAASGKVWNMASTQWTYNGAQGVASSIASLRDLRDRLPGVLLPSHGWPMFEPGPAIDLLEDRLWRLLHLRKEYVPMLEFLERPYEAITPHLLRHRVSMANSFVLLSESKKALFIDFGYDFDTGTPAGSDRASRRPWLYTIPALKRQFGVEKIDVVIPTHHHDDHVAGINLLHEVEGASVWVGENFADVLEHPAAYDLPCLYFDPIPVDRCLPLGVPVPWEEYEITLYPLPGHTQYAVGIAFQVDGFQVLATGDQYQNSDGLRLNYVYQNHYHLDDYARSAAVYRQVAPQLILPGHWAPLWVPPGYFDQLDEQAKALSDLHRELLLEEPYFDAEGVVARMTPYQAFIHSGEALEYEVEVRNPFPYPAQARIQPAAPAGWQPLGSLADSGSLIVELAPLAAGRTRFAMKTPEGYTARRARVAVDVTIDGHRFGLQAEALATVGR